MQGAAPQPGAGVTVPSPTPRNDELVPNLNNYVRSKLSKSEVPGFSDCTRALGEWEAFRTTFGLWQSPDKLAVSRLHILRIQH